MNLLELISKTRSYRRFDPNISISKNTLIEFVRMASLAASARNAQALKYILLSETEDCESVFPLLSWAGYLNDWTGPTEAERPTAYIIVLKDSDISQNIHCDAGLAIQNILLGASEKELGGCIIGAVNRDKLRSIFSIEPKLEILYVVALGKPTETVVIETIQNNDTKYWRDENSVHHVPKRNLEEIIVN